MDSFTVYTQPGCAFCDLAIALLEFEEKAINIVDIKENPHALVMFQAFGLKTVPQVYHNGKHIGGYEDLVRYMEALAE